MNNAALIVVDMQNSFLHTTGENYFDCSVSVVQPIQALLACARKAECLIVHTRDCHRVDLPDFEQKKLPVHCVEGGTHAAYFEGFGPPARTENTAANEIEIIKRRYSAFFDTDLAMTLRECKIEHTVICGVKTNVCVRATCQDAFAHGFQVVVPDVATGSNRDNLAKASLEDIARYIGKVVDLDDAMKLLCDGYTP